MSGRQNLPPFSQQLLKLDAIPTLQALQKLLDGL